MTKYTPKKIQRALNKLPEIKEKQNKAHSLTVQLEQTLNRIKFSMYTPNNFKIFLKERLEKIRQKTIVEMKDKEYLNKKSTITRRSKEKHIKELTDVYSVSRFNNYEDLIWGVQKTQGYDREHYLKLGEIEK